MKRLALCGLCAAAALAGCGPTSKQLREQGVADFKLGRLDAAEKLLQQSLDRDPADPATLYAMGRVQHAKGEYEKAVFYYESCLDVDPSYEIARLWLRKAHTGMGLPAARTRPAP